MRRLVVTFVRIGDLAMLLPLLRHLARGSELHVLARPWTKDLLGGQGWIAGIHGCATPHKGGSWFGDLLWGGERRRLLAEHGGRYDEIIRMARESPAMLRWVAQARGHAVERVIDISLRGPRQPVDQVGDALAAAGIGLDGFDPVPRLDVPEADLAAARADLATLGRRVVLVQTGSSLTDRRWRPRPNLKGLANAQWAAWFARLFAEDSCDAIALVGSRNETAQAAAVVAACPGALRPRLHLRLDWNLRTLAARFAAAHAAISIDTGPGHLAAAVGCPLVSVFGPSDPKLFLPRGPGRVELVLGSAPCQFCLGTPRFDACRDNSCLNRIEIDALMASWRRLAR